MKSIVSTIAIVACLVLFANPASAQDSEFYEKGDLLFNGGISFGYYGYGYLGSRSGGVVPLTASLEYSVNEKISVGPYLGYASWNYSYTGFDYSWSFLAFGARGTFHATSLLNELFDSSMDPGEIDIYGSVLLGAELRTYSGDGDVYTDTSDSNIVLGPVLGCRYYFSDNFGVYLEGGRGAFGLGTIGASIKF